MKRIIYACLIGLSLIFVMSCKKDKDDNNDPSYNEPAGRSKADDAAARSEMDKAYDDVESAYKSGDFDSSSTSSSRTAAVALPCGNVSFNKKTFKIDYNGVNCGKRVLSGSIDVSLITGATFSEEGAKLKIVFNNYKVLYDASQQSITYNGTTYVTNTTGGSLVQLYTGVENVTITHELRGSLAITFDSTGTGTANVTRTWNLFREKAYQNISGTPTGITVTVKGDTAFAITNSYIPGSYANVSEYGVGREGYKFVSVLSVPFKWSNCGKDYSGPYILKEGKVEYTSDLSTNATFTLLGITKGTWTATAGYRYNGSGGYEIDNGCSSDAYKLDADFKKADNSSVYAITSYQLY